MKHGRRREDRRLVGYTIDKRNNCLRILFDNNKFELDKRFKYERGLLIFGKAEFDLESSIVYYLDNYKVCTLNDFVYVCDKVYKNPSVMNSVLDLSKVYCNSRIRFDLMTGKFIFTDEGESVVLLEICGDYLNINNPIAGTVSMPITAIDLILESFKIQQVVPKFSEKTSRVKFCSLNDDEYEELMNMFR